jgi:hypothetical protein
MGPLSPPLELADGEWDELIAWARRERVVGLLHSFAASIALSDEQRHELSREHQIVLARTLRVESSLGPVAEALSAAGVDWRALKGVATSRLLYPEPGCRSFVDIDVLVRPADSAAALQALAPLTNGGPVPLAGRARERARKELTVVDRRGIEIDLHQGIEGSLLLSRLAIEPFFEDPRSIRVGPVDVLAPPSAALFVHATLHSTSVNSTQSSLADVLRLARLTQPDDPAFRSLLDRRSARNLFVWSLQRAGCRVQLPDRWLAYCRTHAARWGATTVIDWVHRDPARIATVNLLTAGDATRRMMETLWPSRRFLDEKGSTRVQNLRRLYRKAFGTPTSSAADPPSGRVG